MGEDEARELNNGEAVSGQQPAASGQEAAASGQEAAEWTEEQGKLFEIESMSDEDLGLDPDIPGRPLTRRELVFVQTYCTNGMIGTPAARKARYKKPHVAQYRLRKRALVDQAIRQELDKIVKDAQLTREGLVVKLRAFIYANPVDLIKENGPDGIILKDLTKLPPELSAAIKKVTVNSKERSGTKGTTRESSVNVELHDPLKAIELAAKMLHYLGEQVDVTSGGKPLPAGMAGPLEIIVRREASNGGRTDTSDPASGSAEGEG